MSKIKSPKATQGRGKVKFNERAAQPESLDYPVFCFKHLHKDYGLDKCTSEEKRAFIEQLVMLSKHDWQTLQTCPRHGIGCEKIALTSIKPTIPYTFTEDVKHLLSFRFDGKKPMIGHRNRYIFHVMFIDRDFTCYKHP